jgi:glycosyltransferase involved in cell wall biosynthesis
MTTGDRRRQSVSACIIARNEEERLPGALESVGFCEELVVIDSGSSDRTAEIARAAGAKLIVHPFRSFGSQRNVAIDHATSDWILEVDADERISPQLRVEIQAFLADVPEGVDICGVPCRDLLFGKPLGPSAKYPKYRLRLFRRGRYHHDETVKVHEGLWAFGRTWAFEGDLQHMLASSPREAIGDVLAYARLEAEQLRGAVSQTDRVRGVLLRPFAKFWYRLLVDGGWRDGWRGVAKIALDCSSDALVWVFAGGDTGAGAAPAHYAKPRERRGSVRLLAIASGFHSSVHASRWLADAAAAGADVALVTDHPPDAARGPVHVRGLERMTPLRLIRALDAEVQLRGVDALVPWGPRERTMTRLLPPELRAPYGQLDPATDPAEAERLVRAATR